MTNSIMPDSEIIKEYNKVTISELNEIISKLKNIKGVPELDNSQNLLLSKIDIHILAEEYNLDPATIYFIGITQKKHELILLI